LTDEIPPEQLKPSTGLIAILDALGAADYSVEGVGEYLASPKDVLAEATRFAQDDVKPIIKRFATASRADHLRGSV
jgi:hypothetical protein